MAQFQDDRWNELLMTYFSRWVCPHASPNVKQKEQIDDVIVIPVSVAEQKQRKNREEVVTEDTRLQTREEGHLSFRQLI